MMFSLQECFLKSHESMYIFPFEPQTFLPVCEEQFGHVHWISVSVSLHFAYGGQDSSLQRGFASFFLADSFVARSEIENKILFVTLLAFGLYSFFFFISFKLLTTLFFSGWLTVHYVLWDGGLWRAGKQPITPNRSPRLKFPMTYLNALIHNRASFMAPLNNWRYRTSLLNHCFPTLMELSEIAKSWHFPLCTKEGDEC